ncbi:glycosyl transferase group 1 [Emticicia oligotrophica DSM 17448]|uniref:Glycosyl transferase group 1 n=1 Tax=Emticicia oligotrophica (strain DSM 17448 / CIP 109782 / MTCC 6937 / GPTSA100-15) TaxID=929562 RepID=A0ABN4AS06_EMTOG|nr:glycosyltransferase family 1 protein [Emticicia oligotrophica]AFK05414.1 glycosyl transferase group 1 [Emticicia oligotrophica DSM 17448]
MIVVNCRFLTQNITGVQRFAIEICKNLKKIEPNIVFVAPHNIIHVDIASELNIVVIGKLSGQIWEQIELPIYLKYKNNPLLINLANTAPIFYTNNVITLHDIAYLVYPEAYSKKFLFWYKFMIPKLLRRAKCIFTVSEFSKNEICRFYDIQPERISVVYNAVSSEFTNKKCIDENKRETFFLALSSLSERKNLISLFKAFNIVSEQKHDVKLFVIGDKVSNSFNTLDVSNYITNGKIVFLGRISDEQIVEYYSNALAFIFPSFYEGFGIPPLEAQACNCPIIVSNQSSLPEIFRNSALYCNPYSVQSIADSMLQIFQDQTRDKLIQLGKTNKERFSWESSTTKFHDIIININ